MVNAKNIIKSLYVPPKDSHKGRNGKLMVIGGSRQYHGAPVFSILAARRFVDLLYFYPAEKDQYLINAVKTIPEAMVDFNLNRIPEMDCVLFGIGLENAKFDLKYVLKKARRLVIDGDGLKLVKEKIPRGSILTPHEGEFRMLFGVSGTEQNVKKMAKKHNCVILKKGPVDIISDGKRIFKNKMHNQGMTKGGTGDVLAGFTSALFCKNPAFDSAVAATYINGFAGNLLKRKMGHNYCASDLADTLAEAHFKVKKI